MQTLFSGLIITALIICSMTTMCKAQDEQRKKKNTEENERDLATISKVYAKYALDEKPGIAIDPDMIGIWKMKEDEDSHNYFVIEHYDNNRYVFTYMNHEGANRTFENDLAFSSKIGKTEFVNVAYYDWKTKAGGYFFLKVIDRGGFEMTVALVADATLKDLPDMAAVRARIAKNMDNPGYFKKPVHFHKILPLMYCK